jgi:hypothetical protein
LLLVGLATFLRLTRKGDKGRRYVEALWILAFLLVFGELKLANYSLEFCINDRLANKTD